MQQRALLLGLVVMSLGGALATGPFDAFIQQAATLANGLTGALLFCPQGLPCQDVKTAAMASVKLSFAVYPWNAWEKPLLVLKPATVADIQMGLAFALQHQLEVAVTSGGHGPGNAGRLPGGFLVSMANFKNVTVNAASRTVLVQGGATVEALNNATAPFGLYVTAGQCYSVGQGFALNGGIGMTPRQVGLGSDSIMQLKVVLANGSYVTVNRKTTPDLFWAMRGAGPAFGIVVETKFKAFKTEGITGGHLVFLDFTKRAFTTAMAMVPQLSKDAKLDFLLATGWNANPPAMLTIVQFLYSDNRTKAEQLAVADSLIKLGPVINTIGNWGYFDPSIDFKGAVKAMEASPNLRHYWLSGGPPSLKENVWTKFSADYTTQIAVKFNYSAAPFTNSLLHLMGGKVARSNSPTGVWQNPVTFILFSAWNNSALDSYNVGALRAVHASLAPFMKLQYAGEMTVDPGVGPNLAALAGGASNVARLQSIKAVYDPTNVFKRHYLPGLMPVAA